MKIVQFSNGKYGVRTRWFFGWWFIDAKPVSDITERLEGAAFFRDCMVDTLEEARSLAARRYKSNNITHIIVEDA